MGMGCFSKCWRAGEGEGVERMGILEDGRDSLDGLFGWGGEGRGLLCWIAVREGGHVLCSQIGGASDYFRERVPSN